MDNLVGVSVFYEVLIMQCCVEFLFVRTLTESCAVLTVHCSFCPVPARQLLNVLYCIGSLHPPGKVFVLRDTIKRTPVVTAFKPQKICSLPG